jgi:hypothetical protein
MAQWLIVTGTVLLLIVAVAICIIGIIKNWKVGGSYGNGAPMALGASMLIACVVVIIGIFIAYFNGIFNRYKTSQDRMAFKYDYMMQYPPVKTMYSLTPSGKVKDTRNAMDFLIEKMPLLKSSIREAIVAITKDNQTKARVERALTNVALNNDTKVLADYDFSLPCIKLALYLYENEKIAKQYPNEITQLYITTIEDLKIDRQKYVYTVDLPNGSRNKMLSNQVDILGALNTYSYFVVAYPKLAKTCVDRNGCPYVLNRDIELETPAK